jgi:hypothetical protein
MLNVLRDASSSEVEEAIVCFLELTVRKRAGSRLRIGESICGHAVM